MGKGGSPKRSDFKMIAQLVEADGNSVELTDNYEDQLGTYGLNGRYWFRCVFVDRTTGQQSNVQVFNLNINS
jgi:hypothetical protein